MISIKRLSSSDVISDAPAYFNDIFETLETHINNLEKVIDDKTKIINLTDKAVSTQNGSMIVNTITLVGTNGVLLSLNPGAIEELLSIDAKGNITCQKVVAESEEEPSEFKEVVAKGVETTDTLKATGLVDFGGAVGLVKNYSVIKLKQNNIGANATTPVKIDDKQIIYFDYSEITNVGGGLNDVKIDISTLKDGQIWRFYLLNKSAVGESRIYNGSTGDELFCFINPLNQSSGYHTIPASAQPAFKPLAQINKKTAWVEVQWTNIGSGIYRFVILDGANMENIEQ